MNLLRRRFFLIWLGCYALCAGSAIGVLWTLYAALGTAQRQAALGLLASTGALPYLLALILLGGSGFLAAWVVRSFFASLCIVREATEIAGAGNPAYRLPEVGPVELRALIAAINALAARHQSALTAVDTRIAEAHTALTTERNRLAVLMSELPQSVIVASSDGRILLYNAQARRLFAGNGLIGSGYLGLGRALRDLLPHTALARALDDLRTRTAAGEINPIDTFELALASSRQLKIRIAPMAGMASGAAPAPPAGYVLLLEELGAELARASHPSTGHTAGREPNGRPIFYDFDLFQLPAPGDGFDDEPLRSLAYTVFDTETTGLEPGAGDEIIAIGAVRIVNRRIVTPESFDRLIDPHRPISALSTRIHGIRAEMLQGQLTIVQVLPEFQRYCADTVLVGHNVAFDMRFIADKEAAAGVRFRQPILDTLLLSAVLHPALNDDTLEAIAHRFGIEVVARHNALGDALLTAEIFLKMLPLLDERGIHTLREAQTAAERTRYARIRY